MNKGTENDQERSATDSQPKVGLIPRVPLAAVTRKTEADDDGSRSEPAKPEAPESPAVKPPALRQSVPKKPARKQPKTVKPARPVKARRSVPTDALPITPHAVKPDRSQLAARKMLRKLVQGEAPPTQAMSIVERLAGSPYSNPLVARTGPDASSRKTLDFALSLAETMFRYGAGALEVETSIIAVTTAFGLDNIEVDITNQSVVLNYSPKEHTPTSVLRVVRSWTNNYAGLTQIHQLVTDIIDGGVTRVEASERLEEITTRTKPYARWMVTGAFGVFAAAIVAFIGGGPLGSLIGFGICMSVDLVSRTLGKWRVPEFFAVATSAALVTFTAMAFWWLKVDIAPALVVSAGILLLLPTGRLVSATQDAINGFPVTAGGRYLSAFFVFAGIVAGIAVALVVGVMLGIEQLDVIVSQGSIYPLPVVVLLVFIAVAMICVAEQTDVKLVLPTSLIGVAGYLLYYWVITLGFGYRLAPAVAAVFIGMLARVVSLKLGAPQLVVAVPAVMFLYPGLTIFRSMYDLSVESEIMTSGAVGLFNALTIILAIAGGVVLGDNLARPFTRGLSSNERRNNRRR